MKTKLFIVLFSSLLLGFAFAAAAPQPEDLEKFAVGAADSENIQFGYKLLEQSPNDVSLLAVQGQKLVAIGKGAEAIPLLLKAIQQAKKTGEHLPQYTIRKLAEAYFEIGKYSEASDIFEQLPPTHPDAKRVREVTLTYGLASEYRKWTTIETAHLRLHFSPSFSDTQCRDFAKEREEAFETVNAFFKAKLPKKIDYFVWANLKEAKRVANIPQLGFSVSYACVIHSRYEQSPGHELTHVITFQANHPDNRTRLINEGVAVYFDLTGSNRLARARERVRQSKIDQISIAKYWDMEGNKIPENLMYAVAGAFVERLLLRGGEEKFRRLCADQTPKSAKEIYGDDLDSWISEFEKDLVSTGANANATETTSKDKKADAEETED